MKNLHKDGILFLPINLYLSLSVRGTSKLENRKKGGSIEGNNGGSTIQKKEKKKEKRNNGGPFG